MTDTQENHPTSVMATHGVPDEVFDIMDKYLATDAIEKVQRTVAVVSLAGTALGLTALIAATVRRTGSKPVLKAGVLLVGSTVSYLIAGSAAGWRRRDRVAQLYNVRQPHPG